jgi:hypothetical protein
MECDLVAAGAEKLIVEGMLTFLLVELISESLAGIDKRVWLFLGEVASMHQVLCCGMYQMLIECLILVVVVLWIA